MSKNTYTKDSVSRALMHHELTRAVSLWSPPIVGSGDKWSVVLPNEREPLKLTLREAWILCLGLAAAEQNERAHGDVPRRFQVHYGQGDDGVGYVVTDTTEPGSWRGKVLHRTNNHAEAITVARNLNASPDATTLLEAHES